MQRRKVLSHQAIPSARYLLSKNCHWLLNLLGHTNQPAQRFLTKASFSSQRFSYFPSFSYFSQRFLTKASNAARRMESADTSCLLQHVAETRDSLTVVCSYGAEGRFVRHCYRLVDASIRGLLGFLASSRATRFLGGLCGLLVVLSSLAFALSSAGSSEDIRNSGSTIGLALISSMGVRLQLLTTSSCVYVRDVHPHCSPLDNRDDRCIPSYFFYQFMIEMKTKFTLSNSCIMLKQIHRTNRTQKHVALCSASNN
ncbi:hypothetical protein HPB48_009881 [Haemaphysalis longicornis]|uniref:Uncharacterized protein n=1 Tax=Haemaphysalis longicornis TaxID=44386 RepID=A0A9J6GLI3_HAELO|nr:hypothetical protein HPB48_009881 [Haemaphysalis longicornis]